ncbi:MAG: hypothetical protein ACLS8Q_06585, partial [Anaerovoracaceae bacterium]
IIPTWGSNQTFSSFTPSASPTLSVLSCESPYGSSDRKAQGLTVQWTVSVRAPLRGAQDGRS